MKPNENFNEQPFTAVEIRNLKNGIKQNEKVVEEFKAKLAELERCISVCHSADDSQYFYSLKVETEHCIKEMNMCIALQKKWLAQGHSDESSKFIPYVQDIECTSTL